MPRGRPRKIRVEEYCPCCNNKGYSRQIKSWTKGYKLTTIGWYFRFRHDDRNFRCYKCGKKTGSKECYIDKLVRHQLKNKSSTHALPEFSDIEHAAEVHKLMVKTISKIAVMAKMWPKSEDDKGGLELIRHVCSLTDIYQSSIWMALYEKRLMLEGKKLPAKTKEFFDNIRMANPIMSILGNDIHRIRVFLDYIYIVKFEPLMIFVEEMHTKYGIPHEMIKKKLTRIRQQEGAFGSGKWDQH